MSRALIGLGSNLGDRARQLDRAVHILTTTPGVRGVRTSAWHPCKPIGGPPNQREYLNGAALIQAFLAPEELLARLQQIEQAMARNRGDRWAPRTIDLDLLLFDDIVRSSSLLTLPHPRMAFRKFVLEPATKIAESMVHPTIGWTVRQLLDHISQATAYVAISGSLIGGATAAAIRQLATAAAAKTSWRVLDLSANELEIKLSDSPSLVTSRSIELFGREAEALNRASWSDASGAISTFWIEDVLALADLISPGALDTTWQAVAPGIVPPKLLVACTGSGGAAGAEAPGSELAGRVRDAIQRRASRTGIGPVLWVNLDNPADAEQELVAAIEAMS